MENYLPYVWAAVIVFALIVEANTAALVAIWFIPAALVSMALAFFNVSIAIQIPVFLVLSVVFIILFLKTSKKRQAIRHTPTNADSVIGDVAVVVEPIDNLLYKGQVKVNGQIWSACSSDENEKYQKDEIVKVVAIEGVKLVVKKEN